jgi:hypothetical protein
MFAEGGAVMVDYRRVMSGRRLKTQVPTLIFPLYFAHLMRIKASRLWAVFANVVMRS